jgi:hypothetical protein
MPSRRSSNANVMRSEWKRTVYYLVIPTSFAPGENIPQHRIGPFLSPDEAEAELFKHRQVVKNVGAKWDFEIAMQAEFSPNRNSPGFA